MADGSFLKPGERFDDLERNGLYIIQDPDKFRFGMDAVLLSGFAKVKKNEQVLDMCTGTGIIPLLLSAKTEAAHISGLEIQAESADMAQRSVLANGLEEKIDIVNGDVKHIDEYYKKGSFDVVTCNPPYMQCGSGLKNPDSVKAIARHEVLCTIGDVCRAAVSVLKTGGRFYMVHRPYRLADIFSELIACRLEPKVMTMVHPFADREPNMVLIEAVKNGGRELKVTSPIIVFKEPGVYNDYIRDIYGY